MVEVPATEGDAALRVADSTQDSILAARVEQVCLGDSRHGWDFVVPKPNVSAPKQNVPLEDKSRPDAPEKSRSDARRERQRLARQFARQRTHNMDTE